MSPPVDVATRIGGATRWRGIAGGAIAARKHQVDRGGEKSIPVRSEVDRAGADGAEEE